MLKMYRRTGAELSGQDVDSWARTWQQIPIEDGVRWAEISYLRPVFDRFFPRDGRILEGGCGLAQFVIYYRRRGYDIEGVDFVPGVIERLRTYDPTLPVHVGDITRLNYADGAVRCYVSIGVVEHFEPGSEAALREARRVLAPDGRLIVIVPYANPLRRFWLARRQPPSDRQSELFLAPRKGCGQESAPPGWQFAEYQFTLPEFARILKRCGFEIEQAFPCDIEWGEICQFIYRRLRPSHDASTNGHGLGQTSVGPAAGGLSATNHVSQGWRGALKALWKELIVMEDGRRWWYRPIRWALRRLSGHMICYVCRADHAAASSPGRLPADEQAAEHLGRVMAKERI